jgi:hypothetical protein
VLKNAAFLLRKMIFLQFFKQRTGQIPVLDVFFLPIPLLQAKRANHSIFFTLNALEQSHFDELRISQDSIVLQLQFMRL